MELRYETRDGLGNDIIKQVPVKEFPVIEFEKEELCPICRAPMSEGVEVKKAVSSNFTDWNYFEPARVCAECSRLFSLYPYSYTYEKGKGIGLFNIRQTKDAIMRLPQTVEGSEGWLMAITTSRKKHLFYRTRFQSGKGLTEQTPIFIQLELLTIPTSIGEQRRLFDFVEGLIVLGTNKGILAEGRLQLKTAEALEEHGIAAERVMLRLSEYLSRSSAIQIPLYAAQKDENMTALKAAEKIKAVMEGR